MSRKLCNLMKHKDHYKQSDKLSLPTSLLHEHSSIYLFWGKPCQQDLESIFTEVKGLKRQRDSETQRLPPLTGSNKIKSRVLHQRLAQHSNRSTHKYLKHDSQRAPDKFWDTHSVQRNLFFSLYSDCKEFSLYIQFLREKKKSYKTGILLLKILRNLFPELTQKSLPSH